MALVELVSKLEELEAIKHNLSDAEYNTLKDQIFELEQQTIGDQNANDEKGLRH